MTDTYDLNLTHFANEVKLAFQYLMDAIANIGEKRRAALALAREYADKAAISAYAQDEHVVLHHLRQMIDRVQQS